MTTDTANYASDGFRDAAAASLEDVDALGANGDDRKIILEALLKARLLGAEPTTGQTRQTSGRAPGEPGRAATPSDSADDDVVGRIGAALGLDRDIVEQVFSETDGEPILVVSSRKISQNKAQAAREIAQLIAAARQAAGLGEWTSVRIIRAIVADYGRLDGGNFATSLQQLEDVAVLRGKGQQREIKVTRQGVEAVTDMVRVLAGAE